MTFQCKQTENHAELRSGDWIVTGAGGGGGSKPSNPTEAPNSLRSTAAVQMLYLIGEGEVEGCPNGLFRDVFFDDTPIQSPDGTFNYKNVILDFRHGTISQTSIPGFDGIESESEGSGTLKASLGSATRTIVNPEADAVSIRIATPQMQEFDDKGNIYGSSVWFRIEIAANGGAFQVVAEPNLAGKTTSGFQRSYTFALPKPATSWQIRLTRLTPDSTTSKVQNDIIWQAFRPIVYSKLRYPMSNLLKVGLNAEDFPNGIPKKISIRERQSKIKIPSNYNPVNRTYTGIWDGTFNYAFSDNPAWIFYDLITDDVYGCGSRISANNIDKWELYRIAQYCDELVPDGRGGFEPRFRISCYIDNAESAYNVLNTIASVFRGMCYCEDNVIIPVADMPETPVAIYTDSNVIQEVDDQGRITKPCFTYSGTARTARHSAVLVEWSDPNDFYKTKTAYYQDDELIDRIGYRETQIVEFGCISHGQAIRAAKWLLETEKRETEIVSFSVGSEGATVRPGQIIQIADKNRAGVRAGGRIISVVSPTLIELDSFPGNMPLGQNTMTLLNLDTGLPESRVLLSHTGNFVALASAFSFAVQPSYVWAINNQNLPLQSFKVLMATEIKKGTYEISALKYSLNKYAAIEQGIEIADPKISALPSLNDIPSPPGAITPRESLYDSGAAGVRAKLYLDFALSPSVGVIRNDIEYRPRRFDAGWTALASPVESFYEWLNVPPDTYNFRIRAVNAIGLASEWIESEFTALGLAAPPATPTNFVIGASNAAGMALLQWDKSPDLDVVTGGKFIIKFTASPGVVTWSDGFEVAVISGAATSAQVPLTEGRYLIKSTDSYGAESTNFAIVDSTGLIFQQTNIFATINESPTFFGDKTACNVSGVTLQLSTIDFWDGKPGNWDSIPGNWDDQFGQINWDSIPDNWDSVAGYFDGSTGNAPVAPLGTYEFASPINLGGVYKCRITPILLAKSISQNSFWDSINESWDSVAGTWDGDPPTGSSATLQISVSQDGFNFGAWQNLVLGDYSGWSFRFRVLLQTIDSSVNISVEQLGVIVDMPDRIESGSVTTSASAGVLVNFAKAYHPSAITASRVIVTGTIIAPSLGDYVDVSSVANTGFTLSVRNSAGNRIAKQVHWIARGFGLA
jgi:predicted phage tail protein